MPILIVNFILYRSILIVLFSTTRLNFSAIANAPVLSVEGNNIANSSPPNLETISAARVLSINIADNTLMTSSPMRCP